MPVDSNSTWMTCPLRSLDITPLLHYYETGPAHFSRSDSHRQRVQRLMRAAPRSETVGESQEVLLMVDSVDSSKQQVGYRFTAYLETNLEVDDVVVAPRGSSVYGRLANAQSAGRMAGGATGTTVAAAAPGRQVAVPSESLLEFRLQQPTSLPVSR